MTSGLSSASLNGTRAVASLDNGIAHRGGHKSTQRPSSLNGGDPRSWTRNHLHHGDALDVYREWPAPAAIISDGAYGFDRSVPLPAGLKASHIRNAIATTTTRFSLTSPAVPLYARS